MDAAQDLIKSLEKRNRALSALSMPLQLSTEVTQKDILRFCSLLTPYEVEGFRKIRIGNDNDGGYIYIDEATNIARLAREIDDCYRAAIKAMGQPVSASA